MPSSIEQSRAVVSRSIALETVSSSFPTSGFRPTATFSGVSHSSSTGEGADSRAAVPAASPSGKRRSRPPRAHSCGRASPWATLVLRATPFVPRSVRATSQAGLIGGAVALPVVGLELRCRGTLPQATLDMSDDLAAHGARRCAAFDRGGDKDPAGWPGSDVPSGSDQGVARTLQVWPPSSERLMVPSWRAA
jgi:hypothetical protein